MQDLRQETTRNSPVFAKQQVRNRIINDQQGKQHVTMANKSRFAEARLSENRTQQIWDPEEIEPSAGRE